MSARPPDDRGRAVEQAILRCVTEQADRWFPGTGTSPRLRLNRLVDRPRAVLYGVHIGDESRQPRVLAKVRRGWPGSDGAERGGARPRLAASSLPPSEQSALEYAGLGAIEAMFGSSDPAFGAVRPLAHLVGENTILMDYVSAPTLKDILVRNGRLSPRRVLRPRDRTDRHWSRVGEWLRRFQQEMPSQALPRRQSTRQEVVDQFLAYHEFLTARIGKAALGGVACEGAEIAAQVLPERLAVAVGHGDYAPRNIFSYGDGRLAVFDPMPRWLVPRHEDLCRFLVAIRLSGMQVHTRGGAYARSGLDHREQQVIDGYRAAEHLPLPDLRCYQLLITLDRWSALVDSPPTGWRGRMRAASVQAASGHLRREARRLLDLSVQGAGRSSY